MIVIDPDDLDPEASPLGIPPVRWIADRYRAMIRFVWLEVAETCCLLAAKAYTTIRQLTMAEGVLTGDIGLYMLARKRLSNS